MGATQGTINKTKIMELNRTQRFLKRLGLLKVITETKVVEKEVILIKEVPKVERSVVTLFYPDVNDTIGTMTTKVESIVVPGELKGEVVLEIEAYLRTETGEKEYVEVETDNIPFVKDESKIIFKI